MPPAIFALAVVLFTVLPLAELMLLFWLGRNVLGVMPTLFVCAATGFIGAWLARSQGLATLLQAQEALAAGRFPGDQLLDGACLLVGGVVLLTPGLLTDAVGFVLLLPPSRAVVKRVLRAWWSRRHGVIDV